MRLLPSPNSLWFSHLYSHQIWYQRNFLPNQSCIQLESLASQHDINQATPSHVSQLKKWATSASWQKTGQYFSASMNNVIRGITNAVVIGSYAQVNQSNRIVPGNGANPFRLVRTF